IFGGILHKAPTAPVRFNSEIPSELERIINKALEKDRDLRYQHASDLRADLRRLKRETSGRTLAQPAAETQVAEIPEPPTKISSGRRVPAQSASAPVISSPPAGRAGAARTAASPRGLGAENLSSISASRRWKVLLSAGLPLAMIAGLY